MNSKPDRPRTSLRGALRHIQEEIVAQVAIDRTGITCREVPVRAKAAAWAAILGVYIVGWSEGVRAAVAMLFEWSPMRDVWPTGTVPGRTAKGRRLTTVSAQSLRQGPFDTVLR